MNINKRKNPRGQINLGFLIAVVLLSILILVVVINVIKAIPTFAEDLEQENLKSRAIDLSKLLVDDPGFDPEYSQWSTNLQRVGLADYSSYSNETKWGKLSLDKINYTNTSLTYNFTKTSLGLVDYDFRLIIINNSDSEVILDYYNTSIPTTSKSVSIRRYALVDGTSVNITLQVWES